MSEIPFINDLTADAVRSLLSYDPVTGLLHWRVQRSHQTPVGSIAGAMMKQGYISVMISGRSYLAHRLAWLHSHGEWPQMYIDHIDGDKTNNSLANLRLATKRQNSNNRNRLGYSFYKDRQKYRASISVDGRVIILGWFDTALEARAVYLAATQKYHGEFSVLNRGAAA